MSKIIANQIGTTDGQHEVSVVDIAEKNEVQSLSERVDANARLAVSKDSDTGAASIPAGAETSRPESPVNGMFRYNSDTHQFEGVQDGEWGQIGGGAPILTPGWAISRANIGDGFVAQDGQLLSRATYPDAWAQVQAIGMVITEAEWQADPLKRGMFSDGDGSTTFRLPDANGKQAGSLGAVFLRGDGSLSAGQAGLIQQDALQNITGYVAALYRAAAVSSVGALFVESFGQTPAAPGTFGAVAGDNVSVRIDASRVARTASETRPLNLTVVWTIKLFGAVVNVGSADVAQLASDYANLAAQVQTAYKPSNLVGTVSQAGGVPTGAIIERGSNANGEYVRFADGTQYAWRQDTVTRPTNIVYGSQYRTESVPFYLPVEFVGAFTILPSIYTQSQLVLGAINRIDANQILISGQSASNEALAVLGFTAIGRWY